jgi:hypothetical protein
MQHPRKLAKIANLEARLTRAGRWLATLQKTESRYPWIRLGVLLAGLLAVFAAFSLLPILAGWLVLMLALGAFAFVAYRHQQAIDRISQVRAFQSVLSTQIARAKLDWAHIPPPAPVEVSADHPFARDLDVTGERSLHHLLDSTVMTASSQVLAGWLLQEVPAPRQAVQRQALVRELLERPSLRLQLETHGLATFGLTDAPPEQRARRDFSDLLGWLSKPSAAKSLRPFLIAAAILAVANISLYVLNLAGLIPSLWVVTLAAYLILQSLRFRETSEVFGEAYGLAKQLAQMRVVLGELEKTPYPPGSRLAELCAPICGAGVRPSAALRSISRIVTAASLRGNPLLALLLNLIVPWDMFFAYQFERFKENLSGQVTGWLDTWAQIEALSALANFAALNPEATFPEITPGTAEPVFSATQIGHVLIPDADRVNNDFSVPALGVVDVITGSNMSGKSTFLRTLGTNLVLAYAGAPVAAQSLRVGAFRLYASMTVNDSLADGISFFYAEVRRLKALLDALELDHPLPLFFLIDEIFRGTNNRERRIGSNAYTQALANRHGAGLISTHDLELAHLAETIPSVSNFHFREDILGEQMVFDYKIRPGASPTTNALRIMQIAGLPVEETR